MSPPSSRRDRAPKLKTGGNVLIKDATILTVTKGTIDHGSILVEKGKIAAVGRDLKAAAGRDRDRRRRPGRHARNHRHPLPHRDSRGRQRVQPVDRSRGPGQGCGHRRRRVDLPGPGRRHDHGAALARIGQHDRRTGCRDQAPLRQARTRPDHPRRPPGGEVRPRRERDPARAAGSPTAGWASSR